MGYMGVDSTVIDAYGRRLENMRISVTNECNYRCIFCHAEGDPSGAPSKPSGTLYPMTPDDYWIIAKAAYTLGVRGFKLTGGEPLIRSDIVEIVSHIRAAAPEADISMTTNGYLLGLLASKLRDAGLDRLNISIHSLKPDRYEFITGVNGLERALKGLKAARDAGFKLIKINSVILKGVNSDEIWDLVDLAARFEAMLQLIELHPVGLGAKFFEKYYYPLSKIEEQLGTKAERVVVRSMHNRAVYYLNGTAVEVVRPYGNPLFCAGCNRIRLLAEGLLSPCLNWSGPYVNVLDRIRAALTIEDKVQAAIEAILETNTLRRPYLMWPIKIEGMLSCMPSRELPSTRRARIGIPKKSRIRR